MSEPRPQRRQTRENRPIVCAHSPRISVRATFQSASASNDVDSAYNRAVERQLGELEALERTLNKLDSMATYSDALINGVIEEDYAKVDQLLEDTQMNTVSKRCAAFFAHNERVQIKNSCVYCHQDYGDSISFLAHLQLRHNTSSVRSFRENSFKKLPALDKTNGVRILRREIHRSDGNLCPHSQTF